MTGPEDATPTGGRDTDSRAACLVRDERPASALAAEGFLVDVTDDEADLLSHLDSEPVDVLVVDAACLGRTAGGFLSTLRATAPDTPVVWLVEDVDDLGTAAFGESTTVVERSPDPETWSFLVEKVRAAIRGPSLVGHGPDTYRMLVESARDGLYVLDANAEVTYLNESFAEMLGYDREELLGSNAARTMAEGELERGQTLVQELIESDSRESEVIDMEMETKPGDRITVSVNFVVLTDVDGTYEGLMGVVRDITERKARERELERYETIVETATEPIYVLDEEDRFVRVNGAMTDALGYDRAALLDSHVSMVTDESGVRRHEQLVADLRDGDRERATAELGMEAADGTRRQYDLSAAIIRDDGDVEGTVVTAHDVTELREHQRQLSVLDRVLRHNVRNKMSVVIGHAADIVDEADGAIARRASAIEEAATELLALSDSAREFESVFVDDETRPVTIDVAEVAAAVVQELRLEHPAAEITDTIPAAATAVGHETFELALNELIENAIVHNDREPPTVDVTVERQDGTVEVRVADDGPGLNDTDRRALLRGTESPLEHTQGLGLWLVRWTVEVAGGDIDIADREPRGTEVTVTLPTETG